MKTEKDTLHTFISDMRDYADAGASLIHVRTDEHDRTMTAILSSILNDKDSVELWSFQEGFVTPTITNMKNIITNPTPTHKDLIAAMTLPYEYFKYLDSPTSKSPVGQKPPFMEAGKDVNSHYMIFTGVPLDVFKMPSVKSLLHTLASRLPPTPIRIIFITDDFSISEETPDSLVSLRMKTPSVLELGNIFRSIADDLGVSDGFDIAGLKAQAEVAAKMGAGMSKTQFENATSLAIIRSIREGYDNEIDFTSRVIEGVADGKKEVINNSDLLELMPRGEDMNSVGGMDNLKDWINKRKGLYSEEALAFGARPPKGAVLVGVAGCGKSLVGKAIGAALQVPVVRLDIGRMFNSYIGASEDRIRKALQLAESVAPCVLFIDEIDKGLGGAGGGGDSGVSSRVLGTILSWLQDNTKPVFTLVTANNIECLPPELLRRGRFDAIFSCVLPTDDERTDILRIHLEKRDRDMDEICEAGSDDHLDFIRASDGYVPAEIESAVEDAIVEAFSEGSEVDMEMIVEALGNMVPMSKSYADKVAAIIKWSKDNATPVSRVKTVAGRDKAKRPTARRIRQRG